MIDDTNAPTPIRPLFKSSMMPDWVITVGGYACFIGVLAAEGLVTAFSAVTGVDAKKLPSPLTNFMGREP